MVLRDAILSLDASVDDRCILAKRPWTSESECKLISPAKDGRVPDTDKACGYEYFLEVSVVWEEVLKPARNVLTPEQCVAAAIHYATFDANPEWLNQLCRQNHQSQS